MAINIQPNGFSVQTMRVQLRPILPEEEEQWNELMETHHPLGNVKYTGYRIKYVAEHRERAVALLCVSGAAFQLADRDRWIGWSREQMTCRRNFVVQNSRFLILSQERKANLASRILSLCSKRLPNDWLSRYGFEPLLLETFVDPVHFRGVCYKAAGWTKVGQSRGFRRSGESFYSDDSHPKDIWLKPLCPNASEILCADTLPESMRPHETTLPAKQVANRLGCERLSSLAAVLRTLKDPRRSAGRRYPLSCCLGIVICGTLAGCKGMRECAELGASLSQSQLRVLRSWRNPKTRRYESPSFTTLWRTVSGVDASEVERVVSEWFRAEELPPESIALDGKVLRATLQNEDGGTNMVSAVSHAGTPFFFSKSQPHRKPEN